MTDLSRAKRLLSAAVVASHAAGAAVWRIRSELLTFAAILGGWALVTLGVAYLTAPIAWAFSAGVFLLSMAGWQLVFTVARRGLYNLTREKPASRDA